MAHFAFSMQNCIYYFRWTAVLIALAKAFCRETLNVKYVEYIFARPLNLATMFFAPRRKRPKIGNTGTQSGFFGPMDIRKEKKFSTFMN